MSSQKNASTRSSQTSMQEHSLPFHSPSLTICTMTIGMMIGATMETSTVTMALPSQWTGSTTETKTVLMARTKWIWADPMMSSCAMMVKPFQWTGSTTAWMIVLVVKMNLTLATMAVMRITSSTAPTTEKHMPRVWVESSAQRDLMSLQSVQMAKNVFALMWTAVASTATMIGDT